ncbi:MAG: hypothetical protein P1P77_15975 [Spirochaetaceae bacterium]|nr:hypothetical protein [Spirochaetaceae bacterium]
MRKENFWLEAGTKGNRKVISGGTITEEAPLEVSFFVKDDGKSVRAVTVRCSADGLWNRIRIYAADTGVILDRQWGR